MKKIMKKILIVKYYNFLMFLEDIFGGIDTAINNHRTRIDEKYYMKYVALKKQEYPATDNIYRHFD